jgi:hypothetical protein
VALAQLLEAMVLMGLLLVMVMEELEVWAVLIELLELLVCPVQMA